MGRGVIRKMLGTGVIGSGVGTALTAVGNAIGPASAVDGGMNYATRMAAMHDWHPTDLGTAALVSGAIGLGIGAAVRHSEYKKEQASRNAHFGDGANNVRR